MSRKMIPYDAGPVPVDTPIYCTPISKRNVLIPAHYAGRKDGKDYAFVGGRTSHTAGARGTVPIIKWVLK